MRNRINGPSLEFVETSCYLGDAKGAKGGAFNNIFERLRNGWSKFRYLLSS